MIFIPFLCKLGDSPHPSNCNVHNLPFLLYAVKRTNYVIRFNQRFVEVGSQLLQHVTGIVRSMKL